MDQMQPTVSMPHMVQVYPSSVSDSKIQNPQIIHISHTSLAAAHPTKITYHQQAITQDALTIPVSDVDHNHRITSQIVMSCQQTQLQNMQPVTVQSQILQTEVPPLQFTSHMFLPQLPLFKQSVLVEPQPQYFGDYDSYVKEPFTTKIETEQPVGNNKQTECEPVSQSQNEITPHGKRKRSTHPNPSTWAVNVRKLKHQCGEGYTNRRGKYIPPRQIKSTKDCLTNCKHKCNKKISDSDRELIFKAFYTLTSNEKKHFLLNTTERHDVKNPKITDGNVKRLYSYKYFFLVRGTRFTVCKNFYLGTLSISQKPIYNVHAGKSELNIPKPDGRGQSTNSIHATPASLKDGVRDFITSFKSVDSTPIKQFSKKKQHLQENLSIKRMFVMYATECNSKNIHAVRESMFRKILKDEFNIQFNKVKNNQLCANCKEPIKKKKGENNK